MLKLRITYQVDCSSCLVQYLCLGKNLQKVELAELSTLITHIKVVAKGEHIFRAQDPAQYLYAVYSGSCRDYWLDENGNERIDNFYFPGDIIGLESIPNRKYFLSSSALEASQLCMIPIDALLALMKKYDSLLNRVLNISSYKMQNDLHVGMATNATQQVADFILNILYRLKERNEIDDSISLTMSQLDIGNFLGVAHETVNRIMRKMVKDKIIKINRAEISILDIERLKKMGTSINGFGQTA